MKLKEYKAFLAQIANVCFTLTIARAILQCMYRFDVEGKV